MREGRNCNRQFAEYKSIIPLYRPAADQCNRAVLTLKKGCKMTALNVSDPKGKRKWGRGEEKGVEVGVRTPGPSYIHQSQHQRTQVSLETGSLGRWEKPMGEEEIGGEGTFLSSTGTGKQGVCRRRADDLRRRPSPSFWAPWEFRSVKGRKA